MKKYNLLKVIAITVLITWLLTVIIPGSYVGYTGEITKNAVASNGIWGLFSNLSISISYFNGIAVFLIAVACFYAVLNKISAYERFVNKVSSIFVEKKGLLVSITSVIFGILALFLSDALVLIVFIPFIYQVMKRLDIDKKVILSSTIIASIIGSMCAIYNSTLFSLLSLKLNTLLLVKLIVFVLSMIVLLFFIAPKKEVKNQNKAAIKNVKKNETVKTVETSKDEKKVDKTVYAILTILLGTIGINKFYAGKIKSGILCILFCWTLVPTILSIAEFIAVLTEKKDGNGQISVCSQRRSNVLFGTSLVLFTLFVVFCVIPWESLISNCTIFTDFNTWLSSIKIGDYAVFNNIIASPISIDTTTGSSTGVLNQFGAWSITDIAILLFIITGVIVASSKLKFNEFIETTTSAIKRILPIAITAMLISIVLVMMVTTGVNITIANLIISITNGFNIATSILASIVGSVLTADFYYFASTIGSVFTTLITDTEVYGVLGFIMQSVYYLMMIIAPTSVGLIIGLYFLDIPYNKWFKFIWKVLLSLFIIVIIASIIIFALV